MDVIERKKQKIILKMAVVTSFITTFMGSALNLAIPNLEGEFEVSGAMIGWVVTSYTLTVAATSVPIGKVADTKGKQRVLISGIIAFGLTSVSCIFAGNIWVMILFRIMQGIASAMIFSTANAILISAFPGEQRGRVLGISTAAVYVGLSVGPVAGGILNSALGWKSIFIASGIVAAIALILAIAGKIKEESVQYEALDVAGNILYVLMITSGLYGLTNLTISHYAWISLIAGIGFGISFVIIESKGKNPIIRIGMFTEEPMFAFANLAALLNYGATFAISYLLSIYLQVVMGYTSQIAGLILIIQPAVQAIFSPAMGKLSDKVLPYKLTSIGMGICGIGLIIFSTLDEKTSLPIIILTLAASGFGFALFASPNTNAIMSCVEKRDYSLANSILTTMRTYGHTLSMAVVTIIVGTTLGDVQMDKVPQVQLIDTIQKCFIVFIVLCIAGIIMSLKSRRRGEHIM